MNEEELSELSKLQWMPSRIPKRPALVTFVQEQTACPQPVREAMESSTESRWYPEDGGYLVHILYNGQDYDQEVLELQSDAWAFEDCHSCDGHIQPMELCYVTSSGHYVALCQTCYLSHVVSRRVSSGA